MFDPLGTKKKKKHVIVKLIIFRLAFLPRKLNLVTIDLFFFERERR